MHRNVTSVAYDEAGAHVLQNHFRQLSHFTFRRFQTRYGGYQILVQKVFEGDLSCDAIRFVVRFVMRFANSN